MSENLSNIDPDDSVTLYFEVGNTHKIVKNAKISKRHGKLLNHKWVAFIKLKDHVQHRYIGNLIS